MSPDPGPVDPDLEREMLAELRAGLRRSARAETWPEFRAAWRLLRRLASGLWLRFGYRPWARFLHRLDLHHTRTVGPLEPGGGYVQRCDWCGVSRAWGRAPDIGEQGPETLRVGKAASA